MPVILGQEKRLFHSLDILFDAWLYGTQRLKGTEAQGGSWTEGGVFGSHFYM